MLLTLLKPSSPQADALAEISWLVLMIAVVIFLVVAGLVTIITFKFRQRPGREVPQSTGNTKVEIAWTIPPVLILIVVFFFTVKTMYAVDPPEGDRQADIIVTGHQWWWEVRYPKSGVITANEVHIPVGKKLLVRLESADVIHDFWVPQLARKIDAIPGRSNYLYLQADQAGEYRGVCAEFCGTQHAGMRLLVVAQSQEEFKNWQSGQVKVPTPGQSPEALLGAKLFSQKTCFNCHQVAGSGSTETIGPDLTYVATRRTLGSGVLKNSPENLAAWLKNPQKFKPGSHMPDFQLSDQEVKALVAYLESLP